MIAVPLGDAGTATLVVPPGAVDSLEVIDVIPVVADNGDYGVLLEPAGVWLSEPATLRFDGVPGEPLARVDLATSWYTAAATTDDGSIPVVRLRPFLQSTQPEAAVAIDFAQSWDELVSPRLALIDESDVDPFDLAASKEEHDAARRMTAPLTVDSSSTSTTSTTVVSGGGGGDDSETPPSSVKPDDEGNNGEEGGDHESEVRDGAGTLIEGDGTRVDICGTTKADAQRAVEVARTANSPLPKKKGECIDVKIDVTAIVEIEFQGRLIQESVSGNQAGVSTEDGNTTTVDLKGELKGAAEINSLGLSLLAVAAAELADTPPPPIDESLCEVDDLFGGSVAVTTTTIENDRFLVELSPTPGSYPADCAGFSANVPSIIWDMIGVILGGQGAKPFKFTMPKNPNVTRVFSNLDSSEILLAAPDSNGKIRVTQGGATISINLTVSVNYVPAT
jgi:hypothetical protein